VKRHACALKLSGAIGKGEGDADSLRRSLLDLEKGASAGTLPETCSAEPQLSDPAGGGTFDEALRAMQRGEERRKALAGWWKSSGQREELARTAAGASSKVADELEAAELSEDVLGSGPLGGLDVGKERGSASARKANERFLAAAKSIGRDRAEVKRLLAETESQHRPLQYYFTGLLAARPGGGGR
jgi:hypothetical protein